MKVSSNTPGHLIFVIQARSTKVPTPEVAASLFSKYFPRDDYQKDAVANFLRNLSSMCSPSGRVIPEFYAQALKFKIFQ